MQQFILLHLFYIFLRKKVYMREAVKGFGDEIPKQVWAAAQRILRSDGAYRFDMPA